MARLTAAQKVERAALMEAKALFASEEGDDLLARVRAMQERMPRGGQADKVLGNVALVLTGAQAFFSAVAPAAD